MTTERNIRASILEMTSDEIEDRVPCLSIDYAFGATPFGEIIVAATGRGVCALLFADERTVALAELQAMFPHAICTERMTPLMRDAIPAFEPSKGNVAKSLPPLHLKGTPFQLAVWGALTEIPQGELVTYSDIAARIGCPSACRAVGSAVGSNPVSLIVPCHRVVPRGKGGGKASFGQYRWGSERKAALINHELIHKQ